MSDHTIVKASLRAVRAWTTPTAPRAAVACAVILTSLAGCQSGFDRIDVRTEALLADSSGQLGPEAITPRMSIRSNDPTSARLYDEDPQTVNPASSDLTFTPEQAPAEEETDVLMQRLDGYNVLSTGALQLNLEDALSLAIASGREYEFAEEEYVLTALRLLTQRHLWGPRFFNETGATVSGVGDNGLYDTSLRLVNEFRVTQRLPYGGDVSARALAEATEDLHLKVAGEGIQTADLIFAADIPLLRGAGMVAREDLIQAERNMVYSARDFERFRREYLFEIAVDFLNLVVAKQAIVNSEKAVILNEQAERRARARVDSGRDPPFDATLAAQDTLFSRDRLNVQRERYRLDIDRFKVRLGLPEYQAIVIEESTLGLPIPVRDMGAAISMAMLYRLDLQTRRDQVDDSRRSVLNAQNDLLGDLDIAGSVTVPTDSDKDRAGLQFEPRDSGFFASITYGLPLDREIERIAVRRAEIALGRSVRDYDEFRDNIAVEVRRAVREIDRSRFSVELQEENVRIAERRMREIEVAPDRAVARDRSEAITALNGARDVYDGAVRDLQIAILGYLLATGQLRVNPMGAIQPLSGMVLADDPVAPNPPGGGPGVGPGGAGP